MKKLFFAAIAAFVFAVGSHGGIVPAAHAATLTPDQTASLQQKLDVMKARLIQLQMQNGVIPDGDSGTGMVLGASAVSVNALQASSLSPAQVAQIGATLDALRSTLVSLQSTLASNPELSATSQASTVLTLQAIGKTLALIGASFSGANTAANTAPIALQTPAESHLVPRESPSPVVASANKREASAPGAKEASPVTAPVATAQVSSILSLSKAFSKAHWPTITIIALIMLALVVLFWPSRKEELSKAQVVTKSVPPVSVKTYPANISVSASPARSGQTLNVQSAKVTVVRPPELSRKTA